jgi:hypothetical protein
MKMPFLLSGDSPSKLPLAGDLWLLRVLLRKDIIFCKYLLLRSVVDISALFFLLKLSATISSLLVKV